MITPWIPSIIIAGAGLVTGFVVEFILLERLRRLAEKTSWEGDEVIFRTMKGVTLLWFTFMGAYISASYAPLDPLTSNYVKKSLFIVGILMTTLFVSKLVSGFIRTYTEKISGRFPMTSIFTSVMRVFIYTIGGLIILQSLGISVTPVLTALGVGGLAVALALQDTLSNLFAGFHIIASKSIRPGDFVKLQSGEEGYIQDINWRATTVRYADHLIIIPNSKMASSIIVNFNLPETNTLVRVPFVINSNVNLKILEDIALDTARHIIATVPGCDQLTEPVVRFTGMDEFGIRVLVIFTTKEYDHQFPARSEFIKKLHENLIAKGLESYLPFRTVIVKNP